MSDPSEPRRFDLIPAEGFRSAAAATFVAQLDDLTRRLTQDVSGLGSDDLARQPQRGVNTIGMLLAHMAIVEVAWTDVILGGQSDPRARVPLILGIAATDDGLPLAADGTPPALLNGRAWPFFADLHARARQHLTSLAREQTDEEFARPVPRQRVDGPYLITPRWTLHHLVEHYMGHYGQILLLRHLHEGAKGASTL
jgi:uncharacterized damage-inducible protein DinB